MTLKFAYHDYEYNQVSEPSLNLVSCALLVNPLQGAESFWLHKNETDKEKLRDRYLWLKQEGYILVAFNVEAEARSMIDLGIDPLEFEWVDLFLEFMMLMNHNNKFAFGEHYVDGRVVKLNYWKDKKPSASLVTALFKMCGIKVDSKHKNEMRDLIISNPTEFSPDDRLAILKYGESDVVYLPLLHQRIWEAYARNFPRKVSEGIFEQAKRRARYAVRTAYMVKRGYPINVEWARNLSGNTGALLDSLIRDINEQFPGDVNHQPFYWNKANKRWSMDQANIRAWLRATGNDKGWPLTEGGKDGLKKDLSLSAEHFEDRFSYSHTYPRGNYGAQMVRYFKLYSSLNGFRKTADELNDREAKGTKKKKKFWDYVGSDGMVRPYMGIFVAQSSRSQPAATGYIMLKPAWQRSIIQPPPGKMIVGCDYSSQEFLISAITSGDKKMLAAYASGDVYLAFGKDIKAIPPEGTKQTHKALRDQCKSTVLGLSYLMTEYGLAKKLTADTGEYWSEDRALGMVEKFDAAYAVFSEKRQDTIDEYYQRGYIQLVDGFLMGPDNRNKRSVANMPIQGTGGVAMRNAVELCESDRIEVINTLHDALYIMVDHGDWDAVRRFNAHMKKAFIDCFPGKEKEASLIRTDLYGWGPGFDQDQEIEIPECGKVFFSNIYIDERAISEWDQFKSFLTSVSGAAVL